MDGSEGVPAHWDVPSSVKVGYEISFTRYCSKNQPLRSLEETRAAAMTLDHETANLLREIAAIRERLVATLDSTRSTL